LVREIFGDENFEYYRRKEEFFNAYKGLDKSSFEIMALRRLLKTPDINSIKEELSHSGVEIVLNSFNELSDADKIEVLKELKLISVKVERLS